MIEIAQNESCLAITVTAGYLDATNANVFKEQAKAAVSSEVDHGELDLSAVEFIDSSGIGAILSLYKQLNNRLVLINPQPTVLSILELLRLHRIFQIESRGA
jgi:anti-sigma B factor antagonist